MSDLDVGVEDGRTKGERGEGLFVLWFKEREKVFGRLTEVRAVSDGGVRDGFGKPLEGDGISCGFGSYEKNFVAAVVVGGRSYVETSEAMGSEGAALVWCLVHQNFCTRDG